MNKREKDNNIVVGDIELSAAGILEQFSYGVLIMDREGKVCYWNEGMERLFGYSAEDIMAQKAKLLYPDPKKGNFEQDLEKIKSGDTMTGQWLGKHKDGTWIWVDLNAHLLKDKEGVARGIISSLYSIESEKKIEKELDESRARANAILETTVDGIITINIDGIIQSANPAAEEIFGYKEQEMFGRNVNMLMPSPYQEQHDDYLQNYLETGQKKIIGIGREVRGKRKDGTIFPLKLAVSEVRWNGNRIFTGIMEDISERRMLENKILEISDEERRRIGQDLHDGLGQMLTGIGLMSQNLARKMKTNGIPGAEEVQKMTNMIKEADEYARTISHSLVPFELDSMGIKTALENLCRRAQKLFEIDCRFIGKGKADIPDQSLSLHLYRIAQEALNNAVRHGKATKIDVLLDGTNGEQRLIIEDNGVGFPSRESISENEGMGVHTMRYRAHIAGGELNISESDTGGTKIACVVPSYKTES